jgi:hypothetical protein
MGLDRICWVAPQAQEPATPDRGGPTDSIPVTGGGPARSGIRTSGTFAVGARRPRIDQLRECGVETAAVSAGQGGPIDRITSWARSSPSIVRTKRSVERHLVGEDRRRILEELVAHQPNATGSQEALTTLTLQSAQQTIPLMAMVLEATGRDLLPLEDIATYGASRARPSDVDELAGLLGSYGSHKASHHNYHLFYGAILDRASVHGLLEIGLGTNDPGVVSTMNGTGRPGSSLRAFRDYLPEAQIFGADIDERVLFSEERISTCFVDQTALGSFESIAAMVDGDDLDVIIDDGLHSPSAGLAVLLFGLSRLRVNGWIVIEEIRAEAVPIWQVVAALLPANHAPVLLQALDGIIFATQRIE